MIPQNLTMRLNTFVPMVGNWSAFSEDGVKKTAAWSGSAPFCEVVDCGAPPTIPNGRVSTMTTTFASKTNYSCLDGYRLIGHDTVTCGAKGIWEPAIPVCYGMV
ncbi:hypothetical protein KIN20_028271 [Parelaphostrongylus tenuis]|uniref:Sushi domain-containing protein n=1 Tax=Parelaphostrongylus tenuis TaxID=148309 RepID=A0AAD5WEM5_PARTN|nr:hypothetical protein KIN20_028271 [Parelaphostrongylus tenuis]